MNGLLVKKFQSYFVDGDANLNSRADEDLDLFNPDVALIPALQTGSPATLEGLPSNCAAPLSSGAFWRFPVLTTPSDAEVQAFSDRALLTSVIK